MANTLSSRILDLGLNLLNTECNKLTICSADPTTYTEANSTFALANSAPGAGSVFGAPANATPNGRKASSAAITGASVTATGTGTKWAAIDTANSRLLANGSLSASQALTSGNTFNLPSFDVAIPAI